MHPNSLKILIQRILISINQTFAQMIHNFEKYLSILFSACINNFAFIQPNFYFINFNGFNFN